MLTNYKHWVILVVGMIEWGKRDNGTYFVRI